jgi:hypothetical protein
MITSATPLEALRSTFVAMLPRIVSHGEFVFRRVRCPHRRADCLAELTALCWSWLVRLAQQGRDGSRFVSALSAFAARQVWSGRRLSGGENSRDVLSGRARRRHGFRVEPLPVSTRRPFDDFYGSVHGQQELDAFEERLRDNSTTPPPDAAAFRIDFRSWLQTRAERDRRLIADMMKDEKTSDLARRYGLSPARISQLRREFRADWLCFCGEREPDRPWVPA